MAITKHNKILIYLENTKELKYDKSKQKKRIYLSCKIKIKPELGYEPDLCKERIFKPLFGWTEVNRWIKYVDVTFGWKTGNSIKKYWCNATVNFLRYQGCKRLCLSLVNFGHWRKKLFTVSILKYQNRNYKQD